MHSEKGVEVTLLNAGGQPIKDKQDPKAPPPEALEMMLQLADMVLMHEARAFTETNGNTWQKLEAAHNAFGVARRPLTPQEFKSGSRRVWLAPHLFGEVELAVAPPGASKIRMLCRDIRAQFAVLHADGVPGVPIMGIGPLHLLKQIERDAKAARAAGHHVGPVRDVAKHEEG